MRKHHHVAILGLVDQGSGWEWRNDQIRSVEFIKQAGCRKARGYLHQDVPVRKYGRRAVSRTEAVGKRRPCRPLACRGVVDRGLVVRSYRKNGAIRPKDRGTDFWNDFLSAVAGDDER